MPAYPSSFIAFALSLGPIMEVYHQSVASHDRELPEPVISQDEKIRMDTLKNAIPGKAQDSILYLSSEILGPLYTLRSHRPDNQSYIWIDSLCINQDSSMEKLQQISLMSQIYQNTCKSKIRLGRALHKTSAINDLLDETGTGNSRQKIATPPEKLLDQICHLFPELCSIIELSDEFGRRQERPLQRSKKISSSMSQGLFEYSAEASHLNVPQKQDLSYELSRALARFIISGGYAFDFSNMIVRRLILLSEKS